MTTPPPHLLARTHLTSSSGTQLSSWSQDFFSGPLSLKPENKAIGRRIQEILILIFTFITLEHDLSVRQDGSVIPWAIIQNPIGNLFMLRTYLD